MIRKRQLYIEKYGPEAGSRLYRAHQSQAAHAGVSARLRRKLEALRRGEPWPPTRARTAIESTPMLPMFAEPETADAAGG
jgi:hypothetical protein